MLWGEGRGPAEEMTLAVTVRKLPEGGKDRCQINH